MLHLKYLKKTGLLDFLLCCLFGINTYNISPRSVSLLLLIVLKTNLPCAFSLQAMHVQAYNNIQCSIVKLLHFLCQVPVFFLPRREESSADEDLHQMDECVPAESEAQINTVSPKLFIL